MVLTEAIWPREAQFMLVIIRQSVGACAFYAIDGRDGNKTKAPGRGTEPKILQLHPR